MAVENVHFRSWRQWGDIEHTVDITFSPRYAYAFCGLAGTISDGRSWCGIVEVRTRPNEDGGDVIEKFTDFYWNWPGAVYRQRMTAITFRMTTYDKWQTARAVCTVLSAPA